MAEFKKFKVESGKVTIGEQEFNIDKAKPFLIKKKLFGVIPFAQPLYLLKWDSYTPAHYEVGYSETENGETKKELNLIDIEFLKNKEYTPEFHKTLADMKFLKNMSKYSGGSGKSLPLGNIVFIIMIIIGVITAISMFGMG